MFQIHGPFGPRDQRHLRHGVAHHRHLAGGGKGGPARFGRIGHADLLVAQRIHGVRKHLITRHGDPHPVLIHGVDLQPGEVQRLRLLNIGGLVRRGHGDAGDIAGGGRFQIFQIGKLHPALHAGGPDLHLTEAALDVRHLQHRAGIYLAQLVGGDVSFGVDVGRLRRHLVSARIGRRARQREHRQQRQRQQRGHPSFHQSHP